MHALLVNPWVYDFAAYDLWSRPVGLLTIAAWLKKHGWGVSLIDCRDRFHPRVKQWGAPRQTASGQGRYFSQDITKPEVYRTLPRRYKRYGFPKELFEQLLEEERRPDVVLVTSAMTYWYPAVFDAIRMVKVRFPGTPVILGGIYARLCPHHARALSGADAVCTSNNRGSILKLICTLSGYELTQELSAETIFPAYELYPELVYVTLRSSSGCPFKCSYCGWYALEKRFRREDPGAIVEEIARYYHGRSISQFALYDDSFLYEARRHAHPLLRELIARDMRVHLHLPNGLNIRFIDRQNASLLKDAGVAGVRLGLESASSRRVDKATPEEFITALRWLRQAGFAEGQIAVNILVGLPHQDMREVKESVRFVARQGVVIQLEEYAPVPGSRDFALSGVSLREDPLVHNNFYFAFRQGIDQEVQEIKDIVHGYNKGIPLHG